MNIDVALKNAPLVGISGAMYDYMATDGLDHWKSTLSEWVKTGYDWYDDAYYGTGNAGPIGLVHVIEKDGYSYAYIENMRGDYESIAFTEGYPTQALIDVDPWLKNRIDLIRHCM